MVGWGDFCVGGVDLLYGYGGVGEVGGWFFLVLVYDVCVFFGFGCVVGGLFLFVYVVCVVIWLFGVVGCVVVGGGSDVGVGDDWWFGWG